MTAPFSTPATGRPATCNTLPLAILAAGLCVALVLTVSARFLPFAGALGWLP